MTRSSQRHVEAVAFQPQAGCRSARRLGMKHKLMEEDVHDLNQRSVGSREDRHSSKRLKDRAGTGRS